MANSLGALGLVGIPLAAAILAAILSGGIQLSFFAAIGALAVALAATAVLSAVGGFQLFGSGVDVKDWTIKLTFITTFLTTFYATNIVIGLGLYSSIPFGGSILILGAMTTMYVIGMFDYASA